MYAALRSPLAGACPDLHLFPSCCPPPRPGAGRDLDRLEAGLGLIRQATACLAFFSQVRAAEAHGKPWHQFAFWFGGNVNVFNVVLGAITVSIGLTFW